MPPASAAWCPRSRKAAVAIGADGMIVEVHPCPEKAVSDGAQSLTLDGFRKMMQDLSGYIELWKKERESEMASHKLGHDAVAPVAPLSVAIATRRRWR